MIHGFYGQQTFGQQTIWATDVWEMCLGRLVDMLFGQWVLACI